MGLIDVGYYQYMPNATKCSTLEDVKKSQLGKKQTIIEVDDIYGMLVVHGLGLVGAIIVFCGEMIIMVSFETESNSK